MNIKRLVLGTAAGALAVTGAQAADLPVVVEPVDYVRICDAYGAGYYYIPGTETCLAVRGRIRADFSILTDIDDDSFNVFGDGGYATDSGNGYRFRARAYLFMDSRTATEFGLLRTFTEAQFQAQNGASNGLNINRAFIQFGGLTFGRTGSFMNTAFYGITQAFNGAFRDSTTNVLAYTASFGNGFFATIGLEDATYSSNGVFSLNPNQIAQPGSRIPDLVATIGVDQGWGSAKIGAATHYVQVDNAVTGNTIDDEFGFAVNGEVNVNVPFGSGTTAGIMGAYAYGATSYAGAGFNDTGFGPDGVMVGNNLELSSAYSVNVGLGTALTPTVGFNGRVGYGFIDHDDAVANDAAFIDVEGGLTWSPVSGMDFTLGAQYRYEDIDNLGDGSALGVLFRAQRTF